MNIFLNHVIAVILNSVRIVKENVQYVKTRFVKIVFLSVQIVKICSAKIMEVNVPIVKMWFVLSIIMKRAATVAIQLVQIAEDYVKAAKIYFARNVFGNARCVRWSIV
tara:strand:- start:38 stop:361 length:324 start_codon:yes stop_codon:yes gene_type:complete